MSIGDTAVEAFAENAAARLTFLELSDDQKSTSGELLCDWSSGGTEGRECGC
ncbi:hypothetical protein [Candidatus Korobacter versatilis]|uniref:hypothetical protein n=1 Tax=Candidatus Korobacter versatilis TaxID=658062 RepID=UPI0002F3564E|nr:hypothetical protein [Candidatus Koribacter versatilis]